MPPAEPSPHPPAGPAGERELRLRLATDALGVGVFEVVEGQPLWENDCVYRIFGRDPAHGPIAPRQFWSEVVHPEDAPVMLAQLDQAIAEGRTLSRLCRVRRQDDGRWRWIEFSLDPGRTPDGRRRVVGVVADVTERHEALQRLQDSEAHHRRLSRDLQLQQARLEVALQAAGLGAWEWRIGSERVQWSEGLYRIVGLPLGPGSEPLSLFLDHVEPEDRPAVDANMRALLAEGRFPPIEHRIVRADGQVRWVQSSGRVLHDDDGQAATVVGVTADITDAKQLELRLREQAQHKDEFLAMLGHELRNPLAPIVTAVDALRRGVPPPLAARLHETLQRQSRQLTHLVNDLIEASRITTGRIVIRPQTMAIDEPVSSALEELQPELLRRGQSVSVTWSGRPAPLQGDPTRLSQVLVNLLHNASKFSPDGAPIELTVHERPDDLVLTVRDEGMGIEPALLPRLFELFAQGPAGDDPARGGLGIGLALVRRIVELHGGLVGGRSDGPGRGATFEVVLPRGVART